MAEDSLDSLSGGLRGGEDRGHEHGKALLIGHDGSFGNVSHEWVIEVHIAHVLHHKVHDIKVQPPQYLCFCFDRWGIASHEKCTEIITTHNSLI